MLRVLAVLVFVAVAAGLFLWRTLLPPAPLAVPAQGAVLERVTVVQPGEGRVRAMRIVIEGGRIASMGPPPTEFATPPHRESGAGAEPGPDELVGAFALPGLIDMHVHFPPDTGLRQGEIFAFLMLLHGITSVRDAADVDATSSRPVRDGVREGRFPGPRSFACGPLVDGPEPIWPNSLVVRDAAEATAAVDHLAAEGWDCVKAYDRLSPEALAAVRTAAERHGLPVIGHVPRSVSFETAHLDDVQHLTGVAREPGDDRPFPEVLEGWRRFDEARAQAIVDASLRLGIAHTPTFVVLERGVAYADYESLRTSAEAALLPRFYADVVWSPVEGIPFLRSRTPEHYALMQDGYREGAKLVGRLHRAGVAIHAGTDTQIAFIVPGAALHREIRILSDVAGLGPEAAMAAATTVPGRALRLERVGRLEPGAPADLVLFRRDPTRDLAALDGIVAVVADGRLYRRAELDAQMERYRRYYASPVFDRVSKVLVRRVLARIFAEQEQE